MGMGFGANSADVMDWKEIKKICPKESRALQRALDKAEVDRETFCQCIQHSEWGFTDLANDSDEVLKIESAWDVLFVAFKKKTGGLELVPMFHDHEDSGDRYDDVSGGFFHVDGVYDYTPAGKKFKDKIQRKMWVTFG